MLLVNTNQNLEFQVSRTTTSNVTAVTVPGDSSEKSWMTEETVVQPSSPSVSSCLASASDDRQQLADMKGKPAETPRRYR